MDGEDAINKNDFFLKEIPNVKIGNSSQPVKKTIVKEELQVLRLNEDLQEDVLNTLQYIHGPDFKLNDASIYGEVQSNFLKKYWVDRGSLVVKGGCDYSQYKDAPTEEIDRLRQFGLLRLESYGFHKNHCLEAFEHCNGKLDDALCVLYTKYFSGDSMWKDIDHGMSDNDLLEQRVDEKSSLESIYESAFSEKTKNVWIVSLKLEYLVNIFHKKEPKKVPQLKKKETCRNFIRGNCKYGNKCRFSHEVEKIEHNPSAHLEDYIFDIEIRFSANTKYPYEPPLIFLKTNAVLPPLANLHICKKLYEEAKLLAKDGMPCVYTIVELLQNENEITEHLKEDADFIPPNQKLFPTELQNISKTIKPTHYRKGTTNRSNKKPLTSEEILREDRRIIENHMAKMKQEKFMQMMFQRKKLPAWNLKNDILNTINQSQVIVVSGETGCGKSTQIPQFILDEWIANYYNDDKHIEVVCTQPRRISAIGVAERVADERVDKIGSTVGYQIRLESKISSSTRLTFCTTGILLRRLEGEPTLPNVTHIIVDEVHERSEESDFLLLILKELLLLRSDLKVILMSATMNAALFSQYFGEIPVIAIPGRTFPVQQFFLEDILETTQYVLEEGSEYCKQIKRDYDDIEAMMESGEVGMANSMPRDNIRDEGLNVAQVLARYQVCKQQTVQNLNPKSKQIKRDYDDIEAMMESGEVGMANSMPRDNIRDEGLNVAQVLARYQDYSKLTCKNIFLSDFDKINYELIETILTWIVSGEHEYPRKGTILIFLPGIAEITLLYDQLNVHREFGARAGNYILLPLHSSLTSEEQSAIFRKPKYGERKIVLSTNLAETSVTIDDCVFVIDSGKMKEKRFDPNRNMESLETVWVTRANALQRKGRAGRVMPGVCIHLYTNHRFKHHMLPQPIPEINRIPLEQLILNIKILPNFENRDAAHVLASFIEPPSEENVITAIKRLENVGALDKDDNLTPLGHHLAALPVDVRIGKLMLYGAIFGCVDAALTMAACLSYKNPFVSPFGKRDEANKKKRSFSAGYSDQITVLIAYRKFLQIYQKTPAGGRNFANENFLSHKTLVTIADIKHQFLEFLVDIGFISVDLGRKRRLGYDNVLGITGAEFNRNGDNFRLLTSILCAALYPNIVKILTPSKSFIMSAAGAVPKENKAKELKFSTKQETVFLHPSSINYITTNFPSPYMVYQEKVQTSKVFIKDTTMVPVIPLILFSGYEVDITVQNGNTYILLEEGWIIFQVEQHKIAEMLKLLKQELFDLLEEKIKDPLLNLLHHDKGEKIISTMLKLINT